MKYSVFLILFFLIGCKSVSILEAKKILNKKGNPMGSDYIEYFVSINSKKDFYLYDLFIENDKTKLNYYYKDLKTGLSSYNMLMPFKKGSYAFIFKLNNIDRISKKETVVVKIKVANKTIRKKESILRANTSLISK